MESLQNMASSVMQTASNAASAVQETASAALTTATGGASQDQETQRTAEKKADMAHMSSEDAANLAQKAEDELAEVAKSVPQAAPKKETMEGELEQRFSTEPMQLLAEWKDRTQELESRMKKKQASGAPASDEDREDLERLAREVVWYREKLVKDCGYRTKDLEEDPDLSSIEARLDEMSNFYLAPAEEEKGPLAPLADEEESIRAWQQELTKKLAAITQSTAGLSPSGTKEAEKLMSEIADIKARQASEGLTDKEQDRSEEVWMRTVRLLELRQREFHDKKHSCKDSDEFKALQEELEQLREKLQEHKTRMREDMGLTAKEVKKDSVVNELDERFRTLCDMGGA